MKKWEYAVFALSNMIPFFGKFKLQFLNDRGSEGWELVSIIGDTMYFKRELQ